MSLVYLRGELLRHDDLGESVRRRWTGDCLESGLFQDMFSEELTHSLAAGFCAQLLMLEVGPVALGDADFVGRTARGGAD
jgi:hypothetical protein